ncbi:Bromodomain-containing protein [Trametes meyenii]|nr:Bromodomain-containing protein [Trametes meyenii]
MSKRETRSFVAAGVDVDVPRAKRRKEAPATSSTSPNGKRNADTVNAGHGTRDTKDGAENTGDSDEDKGVVREKGLQLWQSLKDAVNKEGQIASFQFMRLPSKRQYPDYYVQIKRPIALDDIKSKLDSREYTTLEDVRQDFETCFRNAKRYNMKESQIWKDAKFLHKLATKEYSRITGTKEVAPDDGDDKAGSEDEGSAKKKGPNLHRLLKTRLQKLVDKADDRGRVLSAEFMELPSRKQWPMYYQIIKKPQCLENIFKKIKRKEYHNPSDFANDVELVFSNALEFNQEHTQIWDDAVLLREFFRKLMADLPEPYSIPAYVNAGEHPTKIKLKMPAAPTQPIAAPTPTLPSSNDIAVSGSHTASSTALASAIPQAVKTVTQPPPAPRPPTTVKSPQVTPTIPPTPTPGPMLPSPVPSSNVTRSLPFGPTPSKLSVVPQAPKLAHTATLQPVPFSQAPTPATTYYPNAVYQQTLAPAVAPKVPATSSVNPSINPGLTPGPPLAPASAPTVTVARPSPPTTTQHAHPIKYAIVTTMPVGRRLVLHHGGGVRTWAMRLNADETSVLLSDITFLGREDGEESSDEDHDGDKPDGEEGASPTKGKKRSRPPRKRGKTAESKKAKSKATESAGGVQVKVNGIALKGGESGVYEVQPPSGVSMLELGEKGGMIWKVYMDRATA